MKSGSSHVRKRILVTGGSGFIGVNLVKELSKSDYELLNLDVKPPLDSTQNRFWKQTDVLDLSDLQEKVQEFQPHYVFHLAARTDLRGKALLDYEVNTSGTLNVIKCLALLPVPVIKTTYFSSRLVVETGYKPKHIFDYHPSTKYGESKVAMEQIVLDKGSQAGAWSILRPTSIWGPWFETPYRDFYDQIYAGRFFKIAHRNPLKSFGYVGNAVQYAIQIGVTNPDKLSKSVVWLCDLDPLNINEWADLISTSLGKRPAQTLPLSVLRVVASVGDSLSKIGIANFPLTSFRLKNLLTDMIFDTSDLQSLDSSHLLSLEESVRETSKWYLENRII